MNRVIFAGRLTKDAEIRYSPDGKAVARFDLAVNRTFKREGEQEADFFQCAAFGKTAELFGKYVFKGSKIIVEGEVRNNNYTDKNGQKRYGTQILVNRVEFCESRRQEYAPQQWETTQAVPPEQWSPPPEQMRMESNGFVPVDDSIDDNIPF